MKTGPAEHTPRDRGQAAVGSSIRGGSPARYEGIQVLRAVAALLVLVAHTPSVVHAPSEWLRPWLSGGGGIGLDVFFVISGFVVAMSADRPGVTAGGFLLDRATRVLPLYLAASLPFLVLGTTTWRKAWNTLALLPVFDHGAYTNPAHWFGWSVGAELWFYFVFAVVIHRSPERRRTAALAVAAASLVAAGCLHGGEWVLPRFVGMPMFLEFVAGAALCRHRHALGPAAALAFAPAGAAAAYTMATLVPGIGLHDLVLADPKLGLLRAVAWGLPSVLLVAGVVALDQGGLRWPGVLVRLGDRSYSVYLVQPLVMVFLAPVDWPDWRVAWAALLASVLAASWASHRWIERPATKHLRALLRRRTDRGGAPAVRADAARAG